ncbi:hypothetical protein [Streptomyces sp. NPDC096030]|uniref:hypothetical protein n=1 Tax=Streptomyces sp. NPDC096030 TaxID=3155423 RepID=UPI0033205549
MKGWLDEQRGTVLREIHETALYKVRADTFEQYVWDRWKMKRARAYQLMDAAPVLALMSAIADTPPAVSTATALVPVLKTRGADAVRAFLADVSAENEGARLTTAAVKRALKDRGLVPAPKSAEDLEDDTHVTDGHELSEEASRKLTAAADLAARALAQYESALATGVAPAGLDRAAFDLERLRKAGRILAKQTRLPGSP